MPKTCEAIASPSPGRRSVAFGILWILLGPGLASGYSIELPPPPEGFSWKEIPQIKAAFLMPAGWHYRKERKGGTLAFFITKENIESTGRHETGLSINVIRKFKNESAVGYAQRFVASMGATNELIDSWKSEAGKLKGFSCLTRNRAKDQDVRFMMHTLAIGNVETNTLYILWYESPEAAWEEAWKIGQTMLEKFFLDDEI